MNFRSQRFAERQTGSVLYGIHIHPWKDRPTAHLQRKGKDIRLQLPARIRCPMTRRRNLRLRWDGRERPVYPRPWSSPISCAAVVLHSPVRGDEALAPFVEQALARGIKMIAAVGRGAFGTEHEVDLVIIGDGHDKQRFILTTAHMTMADAINYIRALDGCVRFFEVRL